MVFFFNQPQWILHLAHVVVITCCNLMCVPSAIGHGPIGSYCSNFYHHIGIIDIVLAIQLHVLHAIIMDASTPAYILWWLMDRSSSSFLIIFAHVQTVQ